MSFLDVFDIHAFVGFDVSDLSVMRDSDVDGQQPVFSLLPDADFEVVFHPVCLE